MRLLLGQVDILWEQPQENLNRVLGWVEESAPSPGTLVILPEMMPTGFTPALPACALPAGSAWEMALTVEAAQRKIAFLLGMARRGAEGVVTNDALLITGRGVRAVYHKIRPFSGFGEDRRVRSGREIQVVAFAGVRWCPLICFDLRFPELFRIGLQGGAEVFVVIANWPVARRHHWRLLLQARAIENQAIVVGVNRLGGDPNFRYAGDSLVFGPGGGCLFDAADGCGLFPVDIDPESVRAWRREFPAVTGFLENPLTGPPDLRYQRVEAD